MIVSFIDKDHRNWDNHISDFRFAYNTAHHSFLKTSPAFLNFGRNPKPINSLFESENNCNPIIDPKSIELWNERVQKIQVMKDWIIKSLDSAFIKQSKVYNLHRRYSAFKKKRLSINSQKNFILKNKTYFF